MSSLVVLVIVYAVLKVASSYFKKSFSEFEANKPGQAPMPSIPGMEVDEVEDDMDYDTDYDIEESLTPQPVVPVEEIPIVVEKKVEKKVTPTKEEAPQKEAQDDDIHLRTPQEARRAFIYAEIFNRKYD
ncbi:MAG: hypothetical protein IJZ31_02505 [Bacteroidaceae bacterium]|nr:hypothetical protein [Bacteroidaceae bacterium]